MDWNAYRDENETGRPESYWRRRALALAVSLSVFGLLAWVFSGGGGKPASPVQSSQAASVLPAAAYSAAPKPSPAGTAGSARVVASPSSGSAHPLASPSASVRARATSSAAAMTPARVSTGRGGDCSPRAVVLSLLSTRSEYRIGQDPEFDLYAVSTASGTCSFDTAPENLHVVVLSAGHIIWDSADCTRGETSRVLKLSRGIPAQESVTWNRTITLSGCVALASSGPGTYQVQARAAGVVSRVRTFKVADLQVGPQDGGERLADVLYFHYLHER
jgi:hypothetical protein